MKWIPWMFFLLSRSSLVMKQVRTRCRCAGELDGVRRPNRAISADFGELGSGAQIEGQHRRARPDHLLVTAHQVLVADLHGLDQNFSESERGSQQLVAAFDHAPPERRDLLRALAPILDEAHEEVRVPEDPAHPHPSRSRST